MVQSSQLLVTIVSYVIMVLVILNKLASWLDSWLYGAKFPIVSDYRIVCYNGHFCESAIHTNNVSCPLSCV